MDNQTSIEERLAALENEVAAIRNKLDDSAKPDRNNWIEKITGTFEGDEEFGEILRLGAEIRRADRVEDVGI